jgi:mRNA-degrading endonuclease RelE of RelBE toxin-antitoxin system
MHRTTDRFWKCLGKLPEPVKKISRKNFELLKANPSHPSLYFKKVGKFWSVRIGANYRALAIEDGEDFIWVWIGTHDEYERMIKDMG